ncbi:hypothetical protein JCM10908_005449 [Rhodotorula pacifica]|uniref:GNAT family N-acetyltransferase n=1 Tax=Rhodotorula pacifica TaxID=1495444 RepID=UPI00316F4522
MAMRIVTHTSPRDVLSALARDPNADSSATATALGYIYDLATTRFEDKPSADTEEGSEGALEIVVTAWHDETCRLIFTKLGSSVCKIVSPAEPTRLGELAVPHLPDLVQHLLTLVPFHTQPELLRSITGPQVLVDGLLTHWPVARIAEPSMYILPAACSVPPPPSTLPTGHSFQRITDFDALTPSDVSALAALVKDFWGDHSTAPKLNREETILHIRKMATREALWLYRAPATDAVETASSETPPVGFVHTGRPTARTCAIRGVYVEPAHRGHGIATKMVSLTVRAHLAEASPLVVDWDRPLKEQTLEDAATKWGRKAEVCLFVEPHNSSARRAYERVGFKVSDVLWCDVELQGIKPGHW